MLCADRSVEASVRNAGPLDTGRVFAGIASGTEIVAGLLITFGFLGPWVRP